MLSRLTFSSSSIKIGSNGNVPRSQQSNFSTSRTPLANQYKLPDLPYDYGELEPIISADIMKIHHTKHHQAYVNNLNQALEKYSAAESKNDVAAMIALQSAIKFNGKFAGSIIISPSSNTIL